MGLGNGHVETDLHEDVINIANYRIPIRWQPHTPALISKGNTQSPLEIAPRFIGFRGGTQLVAGCKYPRQNPVNVG